MKKIKSEFKSKSPVLTALLLIVVLFLSVLPMRAQQAFEQLTSSLENGMVFKADFTNKYIDVYVTDTVSTTGTIWLNDNGYKIEMAERDIVVQDSVSKVYNKANNQIIISSYDPEDDDFAPSRLIYASKTNYDINEEEKSGSLWVDLQSRDPFAVFQAVIMQLSAETGLPEMIEAIDQDENLNLTRFKNGRLVAGRKVSFELSYPEQAEVVDLRSE